MSVAARHFLIDGYNLLHALGLAPHRLAETGLQMARQRLLDYLADRLSVRAKDVTVIFDAAHAPRRLDSEGDYRGIQVRFARGAEADDAIEELIARAAVPRYLAVVSNDLRLVRAAERRGCAALRCEVFLDWLEELVSSRGAPKTDAAAEAPPAEAEHWLAEFGHLDGDATLGEALPFPDEDCDSANRR